MAGKFELYKDAKGKLRFRLKAGNGEIIAVGEAYDSKASAKNGIASVRSSTATAGFPAGTNDSCSATNDSSAGDFGPYYSGGTGCRMETVRVAAGRCASTPSVSSALGGQRS
jgi:uncharacterized protein YegP (UPF0339 family)